MKKRIVAILMCAVVAMSVTGCSKKDNNNAKEEVNATETEKSETKSAAIQYTASDYVELGDYKGLNVELDTDYVVTDEIVADYINNNIIANYPYYEDTDKTTVESGDFANIDYTGTKDGVEFDGGSATGYVLEIGSGTFIPGFEDGVIGMKVGEEKDLNLTFPEEYQNNPDLAGADVVFKVKLNKIVTKKDITYDTLTDEYISYLGTSAGMSYTSVSELTSAVKSYLEDSAASNKDTAIRSGVLNQLTDCCTVTGLPDGLMDARLADALRQYESYYCSDGEKTLEEYVTENFGTTYDEFLEQIKSEVEQDIDIQLILETIAEKENIKIDEDEYQQFISNLVSQNAYEDESELYLNYAEKEGDGEAYLRKVHLCNKALELIMENANVTVKENTETEEATETATEAATE